MKSPFPEIEGTGTLSANLDSSLDTIIGSSRGVVVRIRVLPTVSRGFKSKKSQRWWAGRASDHNSLLCSEKVSLLTMEQTPRPRTGNIGRINKAKKNNLDSIMSHLDRRGVDYPLFGPE